MTRPRLLDLFCCEGGAGMVARGWHDTAQAYARTYRQET